MVFVIAAKLLTDSLWLISKLLDIVFSKVTIPPDVPLQLKHQCYSKNSNCKMQTALFYVDNKVSGRDKGPIQSNHQLL